MNDECYHIASLGFCPFKQQRDALHLSQSATDKPLGLQETVEPNNAPGTDGVTSRCRRCGWLNSKLRCEHCGEPYWPDNVALHLGHSAADTTHLPQNLNEWLKQPIEIGFPSLLQSAEDNRRLELDQTESFSAWLDQQGDSLAPADSFETWLREREDSI